MSEGQRQEDDIRAAHSERLRAGFRVAAWVATASLLAMAISEFVLSTQPSGVAQILRLAVAVAVIVAARVISRSHAYRRTLAIAASVTWLGVAQLLWLAGTTGGAASPHLGEFLLGVAASAIFLPLNPVAIVTLYPCFYLAFALVATFTTPAGVDRALIQTAHQNAVVVVVMSGVGAWMHYRQLRDAFSWRSALREEARRADLALERARIARDLHDHIGARLTGIALRAEREQKRLSADAHPALSWIQETVRLCLEELRDTIWALSNSGRDARELVATLRRRAEDIADAAGLELVWSIDDAVWNGTLSPGISVALSAILREALTNTIRHSGAKRVTVKLDRRDHLIRMEICDDGKGLGDHPSEGRGLNNMRARAKEQHGDVRMEQASEHGLMVIAEIPWREDMFHEEQAA